ncbi:MAG: gamma-glutamylcyclotransferase family protein [Spirochaetia bacterium]|nr:gamma-glutamylcyclotransferase [Spirochaetota bacterium]MCX8097173.1 gamma-glutamylcyclotransferase [Spirochaetota bacterium]MDW8112654.1 gamma-glutamylcyclotransferase family protein [Spirochaetia bacterium]
MKKENYVFVYGTLRKGLGNHYLLKEAKFIGFAKTKERYTMYARTIPFVNKNIKTSQIIGEVYLVDDETLSKLDYLEGHPSWYYREMIDVILDKGQYDTIPENIHDYSEELKAWIYFNDTEEGRIVTSGDYLDIFRLEFKKVRPSRRLKSSQEVGIFIAF